MNDSSAQCEVTLEPSSAEAPEHGRKLNSQERTRRFRERRRAGILVATVEIGPNVLQYLAHGTQTAADVLASDRALLQSAVQRALRHGCKKWREKAEDGGQ